MPASKTPTPFSSREGCPTGCGCSGFVIALLLWTPALVVARVNGGAVGAAIGLTLLVSIVVGALLLVAAKLSLGGVASEDLQAHRRPHVLFAITYAVTFLICLFAAFVISRSP